MNVVTRIAPSPTGAPHIGTAYIALFNYAFARHHGGRFLLRIEDTDRQRSTAASEAAILAALRWIGLSWDEGPDVGGPAGPYRQSERLDLYQAHCRQLLAADRVYPCFCTAERLAAVRAAQVAAKSDFIGYDRHCAELAPAEAARRVAAGEPHVFRLRTPTTGECELHDRLRDPIRIPWATIDDQVMMKADGYPTYHFANVVDDRGMGVTHVIRGEEWISSLPKHLLLYEAFGWQPPEFVHLPLLRNPDQSKLSKRKNPTSILYYRQAGYLPEALLNFLGLMAYSMADGREIFTLAELVAAFDIDRVSLGGPIFDVVKLRNFNGRYLREMSADALLDRLRQWLLNDDTWRQVVPLAQPRLEQLTDFVPAAAFLFADRLAYAADALLDKAAEPEAVAAQLQVVLWELERVEPWREESIRECLAHVAEVEGLKLKALLAPLFVVVSGARVALPLFSSMAVLGRDMTLRRFHHAFEVLAGAGVALSGKRVKALAKDYAARYGRTVD